MKPMINYVLQYELGLIAIASVVATTFYFAYGPVAAVKMFAGCMAAAHLALAWVFRKAIATFVKRVFFRP
jgi:hypothetical protein